MTRTAATVAVLAAVALLTAAAVGSAGRPPCKPRKLCQPPPTTTTIPTPTPTPEPVPAATPQPTAPYYAAFYYPMYPEWWFQAGVYPRYHPTLGYYRTDDQTVEDAHIRAFGYAHLDVSISSWWGQGDFSDTRLRSLLAETVRLGSPLKWAVYHEPEGNSDPTVAQLAADIAYIRDTLATSSAYLRVPDGRFVVFVYSASPNDLNQSSGFTTRWRQANAELGNPAYISLKVVPDGPSGSSYRQLPDQPDAWHQYNAEQNGDEQPPWSYTVAPGNWHANTPPVFDRTLDLWRQNVSRLVAASEPWRLVVSFNEWWEGTQTEDATEYGSAYMDVLHQLLPG